MKVSFKPLVYSKNKRKDKTFPVNIRIGYKTKYANIDTGLSAGRTELHKPDEEGKKIIEIKNAYILDRCNERIAEYKALLRDAELPENSNALPDNFNVQNIKELLLRGTVRAERIDFMKQFEAYLKANNMSASIKAYETAYNHLRAFAGVSLLVDTITPNKLKEFEEYLKGAVNRWGKTMGTRGINLYMNALKAVYNWMMDELEYKGYKFLYPFRKYKVPAAEYGETKALTKKQLRAIIDTPLTGIRANRARDLFVISLLSVGTNAKDLYMIDSIGERIEYRRSKTQKKRKDNAFISIGVQNELKPYIAKYWGTIGSRPLTQLYSSPSTLNTTIRAGLKQVVKQVNKIHGEGFLGGIVFYDARRSVASIMRNELDINKDDVAKCLNHVNTTTTDRYIEQSFTIIDKCNRSFIDWLFAD